MKKQCQYCGKQIVFLRNTKRYCDDTCRRLAFYSRQGVMSVNGVQTTSLALNSKPDLALNAKNANDSFFEDDLPENSQTAHDQQVLALNAKSEFVQSNEKHEQSTQDVKQPTAAYQRVNSLLLNLVEQYRGDTNAETMFTAPGFYWRGGAEDVWWVTLRLRCIIENLLRLSMAKTVEGKTISRIATALQELVTSDQFVYIPESYPYIELIADLYSRFKELEKQVGKGEVSFCLSVNRRAQLMAAKLAIGEFVPKVSFQSLDFSGKSHNETVQKKQETVQEQDEEAFTHVEQIDSNENSDDPAEPNTNEQS